MEDFTFLVQTRPALLVFLLACACSVFLNAGRLSESCSQWVLIVLDLSCSRNGYELEARATPVEDRRLGIVIWLNPGVVPPPTPAVGQRLVHVKGRICFGSATPTCMGDHRSLEAGNGGRLEGRVPARRVTSPCRLPQAAVRMHECATRSDAPHTQHSTPSVLTGEQEPSGPGHRTRNTAHPARAPVTRSQVAQDTAHGTQCTKRAHR